MRQLLWSNVSHISAVLVALSFWGVLRFTIATKAAYAKPKVVSLILWLLWLALIGWATYAYPGFGPFAAALAVTLLADNHLRASMAVSFGPELFHERITEFVRRSGSAAFLRATVPSQLLHLSLAALLVGLSGGSRDWIYWVALGFASAHVLNILSTLSFAFKYRSLGRQPE